jgi:hypothetical protein
MIIQDFLRAGPAPTSFAALHHLDSTDMSGTAQSESGAAVTEPKMHKWRSKPGGKRI